MPSAVRALLGALIASLLLVAPAGAAVRTNGGNDSTGDAPAAYDIDRADVTLDDQSGAITVALSVTGPLAPNTYVEADFGDFTEGRCSVQSIASVGGRNGGTTETRAVDGTMGTGATVAVDGSTLRLSATVPTAAAKTCVVFRSGPDGGNAVDDTGYLALDPPPAPAPTPTPTTGPTVAPTPTPAPPPPPKAKLRLAFSGVPKSLKSGRTARPTLTIRNAGNAGAKTVKVVFAKARGLTVKPGSVTVKALAAGKAVKVKLRVALGRKARASTPLKVTATGAGGLKRAITGTLRKPGKAKPKPKPTPSKGGLPGTFWWWDDPIAGQGWNLKALRFYPNGYAYSGLPDDEDDTAPASCSAVTAKPDKDGDYGPGCVRWSLQGSKLTTTDPKVVGTYRGGTLTFGKDIEAKRLGAGKAGQRLNLSLEHRDVFGFCGLIGGCTTTHDVLTLQTDGQFGKASSSLTTTGDAGGGAGPFVAVGSYPPDARGTYEVLSGYRIRLSYANGTEKVYPFGIGLGKDGKPATGKDQELVLGEANYYVDPTPD